MKNQPNRLAAAPSRGRCDPDHSRNTEPAMTDTQGQHRRQQCSRSGQQRHCHHADDQQLSGAADLVGPGCSAVEAVVEPATEMPDSRERDPQAGTGVSEHAGIPSRSRGQSKSTAPRRRERTGDHHRVTEILENLTLGCSCVVASVDVSLNRATQVILGFSDDVVGVAMPTHRRRQLVEVGVDQAVVGHGAPPTTRLTAFENVAQLRR